MEKEFVPYEQALALKELGFDKPCLGGYIRFRGSETFELAFYKYRNVDFNTTSNIYVSAPLYQQVFRWFREKHNIIGLVEGGYDDGKNIFTYVIWNGFKDDWCNEYVSTYEEAELECLRKLIEIVKNTSTSK